MKQGVYPITSTRTPQPCSHPQQCSGRPLREAKPKDKIQSPPGPCQLAAVPLARLWPVPVRLWGAQPCGQASS